MADPDPYKVLGVKRGASDRTIKSAYRRLAKSLHPDLNPGDLSATERIKDINAAYSLLSDSARRAEYDRTYFSKVSEKPDADMEISFSAIRAAIFAAIAPSERQTDAQYSRRYGLILAVSLIAVAILPVAVGYATGLGLVAKVMLWGITPLALACSVSSAISIVNSRFRHHAAAGLLTIVAAFLVIYLLADPLLVGR